MSLLLTTPLYPSLGTCHQYLLSGRQQKSPAFNSQENESLSSIWIPVSHTSKQIVFTKNHLHKTHKILAILYLLPSTQ